MHKVGAICYLFLKNLALNFYTWQTSPDISLRFSNT